VDHGPDGTLLFDPDGHWPLPFITLLLLNYHDTIQP
jgi:hypothetical protein